MEYLEKTYKNVLMLNLLSESKQVFIKDIFIFFLNYLLKKHE